MHNYVSHNNSNVIKINNQNYLFTFFDVIKILLFDHSNINKKIKITSK